MHDQPAMLWEVLVWNCSFSLVVRHATCYQFAHSMPAAIVDIIECRHNCPNKKIDKELCHCYTVTVELVVAAAAIMAS